VEEGDVDSAADVVEAVVVGAVAVGAGVVAVAGAEAVDVVVEAVQARKSSLSLTSGTPGCSSPKARLTLFAR
jgi:hypothetical protein